jgi:hypothetical protein
MLQLPVTAKLVRIVGGPAGPNIGPTGPHGLPASSFLGPDGPLGSVGHSGMIGPTGSAGLFEAFLGPTGVKGPLGSDGYPGPVGPTGSGLLCPDDDYIRYYENTDGYSNFTPYGEYVGCKFKYITKSHGFTFVLFTGTYIATSTLQLDVGVFLGVGSAPPNAGERSPAGNANVGGNAGSGWTRLVAPVGYILPFYIQTMFQNLSAPIPIPQERWYDLAANIGTSGFDSPGGIIKNISCIIFEVPGPVT